MSTPRISVIIPCYNQGHFIDEALNNLKFREDNLFEVIIINDGSTDAYTIKRLAELATDGWQVIHQNNQGLSAARNTGIKASRGDYILPLDADNKFRCEYFTEIVTIMDEHPSVAVVYGNAEYFGIKNGVWGVGEYNLQKLMICNYIDACAIIRKSVLQFLGGYDTELRHGLEDWELWLRISFAGHQFWYINKVVFGYRVVEKSMSGLLLKNYQNRNTTYEVIENKYKQYMGGKYITDFYVARFKNNPVLFIIKLISLSYFPRIYNYLLKKNKIVRGL